MSLIDRIVKDSLHRLFPSLLKDTVVQLDEDKSYMLILPEDIPEADIQLAFKQFKNSRSPVNLIIIRSDMVRLIELGGKERK